MNSLQPLTINQALENFNTFKSRYEKGSVSLIAAGVVVCSTYTNEKDAKKALQELFDTTSSSEAEMRDAAIRLYTFHKNDCLAIIQGEKSASAATNALTDYVLSFASDSGAIYGKDEHNRRLLLPKLAHFRKAPKVEPMAKNSDNSEISETSEKQEKEEKKAKTALQLTNEALALLDRVFALSDETSNIAEDTITRFIIATMDVNTAHLTPSLRLAHDRIQASMQRMIEKGELHEAA
jgi:hypothetical protein